MSRTTRTCESDIPANIVDTYRVVTLQQAAALNSCSIDTLKRNHSDKILKLSTRRLGMRLADAIAIGRPAAIVAEASA